MKGKATRGPLGFKIIGVFKIVSAVLLAAVGLRIFRMVGGDVGADLAHLVSRARLDPDNHYLHLAISKVANIDRRHLREIGFGTFAYAVLHLAEGTGLLLHRRWAEYLTVIITVSLIPLEGYEVIRRVNLIKVAVLVVNLAILVYLVIELWQERPERDEAKVEDSITGLEHRGPRPSSR